MVSSCTTVMYPEKESDMSFSSEVKEELAKHISPARHCQIAELARTHELQWTIRTLRRRRFHDRFPDGKRGGCQKRLYIN